MRDLWQRGMLNREGNEKDSLISLPDKIRHRLMHSEDPSGYVIKALSKPLDTKKPPLSAVA
jgi:hypothetical protein